MRIPTRHLLDYEFRGTRDAVHRNRPRGAARVEHLTRLAPS
jgi:hypothetical protein